MKNISWNDGSVYDDPNIRWGDPAYRLEPGDPGYVAPFPPQPKPKKRKMKHNNYYPVRQSEEVLWLTNMVNKLGGHATTLGLSPTQVSAIKADCLWIIYFLQIWLPAVRTWAQSGTDALQEAKTGTGIAAQEIPVFTAPALPVGTVAVLPGALIRIFDAGQRIKESGKLTETIATDLHLVGSEQSAPDLTTLQPVISVSLVGGQPFIKWNWGGQRAFLSSCEIQVDRGDGHGFVLLTIDTTPNYTDTQPLPAVSTKWSYRATYRNGDQQVGIWSQIASLHVPN